MLTRSGDWRIGWTRWTKAQAYEQSFWQELAERIAAGTRDQLGWYSWRAEQLDHRLASIADADARRGRVLEIGSGPIGIVNFLRWGDRCAIDPLEHFYKTKPALVSLRQPGVTYLDGTGEKLPFESGSCALVIIDNVIDHTYAPGRILQEIRRVLRPDGLLYLSVNVHRRWGAFLHTALAVLQIDRGHPYTFTSASLRRILRRHGFRVLTEEIGNYRAARTEDRKGPALRSRIKGWTGLSEFSHAVVCRAEATR